MGPPFLSIVTRCGRRPKALARCVASVVAQTDQDLEHILIVDEEGRGMHAANTSLFENRTRVDGRWVLILDDDDHLVHDTLIGELKEIVEAYSPEVVMVRMDGALGIIPDERVWEKVPVVNHIATPNLIVRADHWKRYIGAFGTRWCGDYYFAKALFDTGLKVYWHDVVAVRVPRRNYGRPE